jgi:hypothetical protein
MFVMGLGNGIVMQNLVLVTQNALRPMELGSGSAGIAFFRSLGATVGVSTLGASLGPRVSDLIKDGLAELDPAVLAAGASSLQGDRIPEVSLLPAPIRAVVESAYGHGIADAFLLPAPLAVVTLLFVCLLPNRPLGTKTAVEQLAEAEATRSRPGLAPATERVLELGANEIGATREGVRDIDLAPAADRW